MRGARNASLLLLLLLLAMPLGADWQTRSWSRWEIDGAGARVLFGVERIELQRLGLPDDPGWLLGELRATVTLADGERACTLQDAAPVLVDEVQLQLRLRFACPQPLAAPRIAVRALLGATANPLHYAALQFGAARHVDALFTRAADTQDFPAAAGAAATVTGTPGRSFVQYLVLGFGHILAGPDHVAFLLCMLLVSPRLGHRLWMVTGFTLGHSLTLSLAALGLLQTRTEAVEALIGFTVAVLAAEAWQGASPRSRTAGMLLIGVLVAGVGAHLLGRLPGLPMQTLAALLALAPAYLLLSARSTRRTRLHLGMTAVFGLVHGLGFATVLRSIGLPAGQRGWALAGFNAGVELGQVMLLLLFAAAIAVSARRAGRLRLEAAERALAGGLCALGLFWFVQRSIG